MILSVRRIQLGTCVLLILAGLALWLRTEPVAHVASAVLICTGLVGGVLIAILLRAPGARERTEPDDIAALDDERRRELMRGTSLFLREMNYRYSVRLDARAARDRPSFSAEVNSIRLGFIPAVITDNTNDRQGFGFVAFVHDGTRWRGPGLPCPADQAEAVRHAARCVSPLSTEEETHFEGPGAG